LDAAHKPSTDVLVAVRNLAKLGGSLGMTLVIGFVIRPLLRRWLGPDAFGPLDAADGFTATAFIVLSLGVDAYIRKEIPVRHEHANDFFASVFFLRLFVSLPLFGGMWVVLQLTHRPPQMQVLVWILGLTQFMTTMNLSLAALLQAKTTVDGLSIVNVASKLLWAAGSLGGVAAGFGIRAVALALLLSETMKAIVSVWLCRKHFGLSLKSVGWGPAKAIVIATLPFYVNTVFHTVYNKVDVFLLGVIADQKLGEAASNLEQGWYGAASSLGGLSMMLVPLLGGVMMPLLARAKDGNPPEYDRLVKRSLELILIVAIPISLALGIGADTWIQVIGGGPAYAPATLSLRLLSPIYLFIYVSIISAVVLQLENHIWTLTWISGVGLVVNMVANLLLIGPALETYGASYGGAACALTQILTEAGVATTMVVMMGRRSIDARTVKMVVKTAVVCVAVVYLDVVLRGKLPQLPGLIRMTLNGIAYALGVVLTGAVNPRELLAFAKQAFARKRGEPAVSPKVAST
jgi:O-antigen/teichoic acid export membrane protein